MIYTDHVMVNGQGVSRQVWIFDALSQQKIITTNSLLDGSFSVDIPDDTDSIIIVATDNYGRVFSSGVAVNMGDIVRPTYYTGIVFEAVNDGFTGELEPLWNVSVGEIIHSGTVTLLAKPYYRPVAKFAPF